MKNHTPIMHLVIAPAAIALAISGCASKSYVEGELADSEARMNTQIEDVQTQVEENQTRLDDHQKIIDDQAEALKEASETARDALERAFAPAGK